MGELAMSYNPSEVVMAIEARLRALEFALCRPMRIIIGRAEEHAIRHSFRPPLEPWSQPAYFCGVPLARIGEPSYLRIYGDRDGLTVEVDDTGRVVPWMGSGDDPG